MSYHIFLDSQIFPLLDIFLHCPRRKVVLNGESNTNQVSLDDVFGLFRKMAGNQIMTSPELTFLTYPICILSSPPHLHSSRLVPFHATIWSFKAEFIAKVRGDLGRDH